MKSIFYIGKLIIIAALANLHAEIAYADWGQRAIEIVCNTKENELEVRPFIMWNEDLKQFMQDHPDGVGKNADGITQVFDQFNPNFIYQCTLEKSKYQISIDFNTLDISLNDQVIIQKKIGYVWDAAGEQYKLELKSDHKWSECSGGETGTVLIPLTCVPLTKSKNTDCDDVIGHCIKSPNPSFKGDEWSRGDDECDYAGNQLQMNACAVRDFETADRELNVIYKELMGSMPETKQKALKNEQRAWLKERDPKCRKEADDEAEGGSMWPMLYQSCRGCKKFCVNGH